jgi:dihydroorotate dehydrogenase (NAD+) catalytic subunit
VKIPIVGVGGIRSADDVIEFLKVGAAAVQIGTWNFRDPFCYEKISKGLESYLEERQFKSLRNIIGLAHRAS